MAVLKNKIELKNVSKVYETRDKQVEVLNNLSFEVHENEFLVLLGPGRCGQDTRWKMRSSKSGKRIKRQLSL